MSEEMVDRLLTLAPFSKIPQDAFPKHLPLRGILRHDTRVQRFRAGELIVRQGDYGNSAFIILSGTVRVVLKPELPISMLGRRETRKRGIFRSIAQLWSNPKEPEVRKRSDLAEEGLKSRQNRRGEVRVALQDVPRVLDEHQTAQIGPGELFGEISALGRIPRTATMFCDTNAELLEIRWQGLRDILRYDTQLRQHVDEIYRKNALATQLVSHPLFGKLDEQALARVIAQTQFVTFGDYEWSGDYKRLIKSGSAAPPEPVILREGDYVDGIVMLRAGFARVSKCFGNGQRTSTYLGAGQIYGMKEIIQNATRRENLLPFEHTVTALGYTHALFIPTATIEEVVLPGVPNSVLKTLSAETGAEPDGESQGIGEGAVDQAMLEFLAENRFFNGTKTMVIDLDACTRCDDCVRACASTHQNNPRFLRHGPINDGIMIADACMHCADPVCLIGCPTGAIHRNASGGEVMVNESTCIGCQVCANNCPYDAIRMAEVRDESGTILVDEQMRPVLKATKCDLCVEQHGGPACQRACPHGALVRMNMTDLGSFAAWLKK